MIWRRRLVAAALLAVVLVGAGFLLGRSSGGSDEEVPVVVDCVQRVETLENAEPEKLQEGAVDTHAVTFVGVDDAVRAQPDEDGTVSIELPVLVAAEQQVTVRARTGGVTLGFGSEEADTRAVTFKACPAFERSVESGKQVGEFTQFVGSIDAEGAGRVELDVRVHGEDDAESVRFGLGEECD